MEEMPHLCRLVRAGNFSCAHVTSCRGVKNSLCHCVAGPGCEKLHED